MLVFPKDDDKSFEELYLSHNIISALAELSSIVKPWPIQIAAFPLIQHRKDLVVRAKTGSGKTHAYLIPLLDAFFVHFERDPFRFGPSVMIIVPTLDIAKAVSAKLRSLIQVARLAPKLYLLKSPAKLKSAFSREVPDIVVSTPDCALASINKGFLAISGSLRVLVIDDIDRLLLNGRQDLESLMDHVPMSSQRLLFSADPSSSVEELATFNGKNPYIITLSEEGVVKIEIRPYNVEQFYITCDECCKIHTMLGILKSEYEHMPEKKLLIFTNSISMSSRVCFFVNELGFKSGVLDPISDDGHRLGLLKGFSRGYLDCLITTAGIPFDSEFGLFKGVDLKNLDAVFHFEMPETVDQYLLRLKCTGGRFIYQSYALICSKDEDIFEEIRCHFKVYKALIPLAACFISGTIDGHVTVSEYSWKLRHGEDRIWWSTTPHYGG